jgi:hypothetical protein
MHFLWNPYLSYPSMKYSVSIFHTQTHRNALRDVQCLPDAKYMFVVMCTGVLFVESAPVPPEQEK